MQAPPTEVTLHHDGAELARVTLLPGEYIIGRSPEADIFAETPLISRQHARLTINYDHVLIEDLGSSNGTFVADQPISESTRLFANQTVRLGDVQVVIHRPRTTSEPGVSLAPAQEAIDRFLPEELLVQKRYAVGQQVARGGMGAILQADQSAMKRRVAMKIMLEGQDEGDVLRFIEEAQITGQLEHPNIVPVHELGIDDQGQLFYTMKLVRGITLKKVLDLMAQGMEATVKKYPLPVLLTIFQKACDAIAFAHNKRVIHRDLKPENIMLGDYGEVLVMDWGLAKVIGEAEAAGEAERSYVVSSRAGSGGSSHTMAGTIMGTPQYMAPEQARGEVETLDARADIYALGAILFEILHLRASVNGTDAWDIVEKVKRGELEWTAPAPAPSTVRGVAPSKKKSPPPASLVGVCRKALALDPEKRYARVDQLQDDITAYQSGFATSAEKASWVKRTTLAIKRNKAVSIATAVVVIAVGTFGTQALSQGRKAARALTDLKRNAPDLLQLAETEASYQRFDSALAKIDGALAIDPNLRAAYWRRAWVLIGLERWTDAAEALRVGQRKDPANTQLAALAPDLDRLAAMPDDEARFASAILPVIMDTLERVGAAGPRLHFASRSAVSGEKKQKLVQERLDQWRGTGTGRMRADLFGPLKWVAVRMSGSTVDSLEPLRGLPIGVLTFSRGISSLEPLRGMPLHELECGGSQISDLAPLRGMPLRRLNIGNTKVTDLSPLRGMPLESADFSNIPATDASVLAGMPLTSLMWPACPLNDLSVLKGAPLRSLSIYSNRIADFSFLQGAPLERLEMHNNRVFSDLHQLAGLPIKDLNIENCPSIKDLEPLLELRSLERVRLTAKRSDLAFLRQHPTLQFIALSSGTYTPIAEFWAESATALDTESPDRRDLRKFEFAGRAEMTSIDLLRGLSFDLIDIRRTGVTDLSPITGMATLRVLRVAGTPIRDFSALKGLKLTELRIGKTSFNDLSLLEGMPLVVLTVDGTPVQDVAPLAKITSLRLLCIPTGAKNIEALRQLPQLKYLSYNFSIDRDTPDKTAAEFWSEYDAEKRARAKK